MRKILLTLACLGLFAGAKAQGVRLLKFTDPERNLGTLRFDSGKRTLEFPFENVSGKTVNILEVRSSCGCFSGEISQKLLKPGAKGVLKAVFDPSTLYGDQNRHLTILATDSQNKILSSITVKAYVQRDESEGKIRFAEDLGANLRSDTSEYSLKKDKEGDFMASFPLYNDSTQPMKLSLSKPMRLKVYGPGEIAPQSRIDLIVKYRPFFKKKGSEIRETLGIKVNGEKVSSIIIKGKIY